MSLPAEADYPGRGQGYPSWPQLVATGGYLAGVQQPDGSIPWEPGRHTDVWDHVECAMALTATGHREAADAAFAWMAAAQRPDGTWPIETVGAQVTDDGYDTNHCAYVAVGVWHHWLVTGDRAAARAMLPVVTAALDTVVAQQLPGGGFAWAVDARGAAFDTGLLAGTSSIWHALDCGIRLAHLLDQDADRWVVARDRAGAAVRSGEGLAAKRRWSMDWYYPVLTGALRGAEGERRIDARWEDFVVPGLGARCVDDRPWVTGAETCELALALDALGRTDEARRLVRAVQHLREQDASYHTGLVYADATRWPIERSTWTAAAVVLAVDAIDRVTPGSGIFRDSGSPLS